MGIQRALQYKRQMEFLCKTVVIDQREYIVQNFYFSVHVSKTHSTLTPRTLGDDSYTRFSGFSSSDLVLSNDAELVFLTFRQVGDVQVVCRWFDLLELNPASVDVSATLNDVPGDGCSTVGLRWIPCQVARNARHVGHLRYTRNTRDI